MASPYFLITYYEELKDLKDLVLIRGETLSGSITKNDSEKILKDFLTFYGQEDNYIQFVKTFN